MSFMVFDESASALSREAASGTDLPGLLDVKIKIRAPKNLLALPWADRMFIAYAMPHLQQGMVARSTRGKAPDGGELPPYSRRYDLFKRRFLRIGRSHLPVDYTLHRQLWDSLTWRFVSTGGARLYFAGRHATKGTQRPITNQRLADLLAQRTGRGLWGNSDDPPHKFMVADQQQEDWIQDNYKRRVVDRGMVSLPPAIKLVDIPVELRKFVQVMK